MGPCLSSRACSIDSSFPVPDGYALPAVRPLTNRPHLMELLGHAPSSSDPGGPGNWRTRARRIARRLVTSSVNSGHGVTADPYGPDPFFPRVSERPSVAATVLHLL